MSEDGPDMVQVERSVLVELLGLALENYVAHDEWDDAERVKQVQDETQAGTRDRLTAAEWREIGGGE